MNTTGSMGTWAMIAYVAILAFMVYRIWTNIRNHPEWLTRESFSKSAYVMGVLALLLIGFVALLVMFLKHS